MANIAEIAVGIVVELFMAALAIGVLYRVWSWFFPVPRRQIVPAFHQGIVLCEGKPEKVIAAGTYWIMPKRTLLLCDVRPKPFQVPAQELLTSDGMVVRVSLGGQYCIANPVSFVTESSDSFGVFYLELRQALRTTVGELNSQNFVGGQDLLTGRMKELLIPRATQLGIEMLHLEVWESVPIGWALK